MNTQEIIKEFEKLKEIATENYNNCDTNDDVNKSYHKGAYHAINTAIEIVKENTTKKP